MSKLILIISAHASVMLPDQCKEEASKILTQHRVNYTQY